MRTTSKHKVPELELVSVLYRGNDDLIAEELRRLAQLVGLDFQVTTLANRTIDAVLTFRSQGLEPLTVQAQFHDMFASYFARGVAQFHVRDDAADVMALMSAVGLPCAVASSGYLALMAEPERRRSRLGWRV